MEFQADTTCRIWCSDQESVIIDDDNFVQYSTIILWDLQMVTLADFCQKNIRQINEILFVLIIVDIEKRIFSLS